MNRRSVLIVLGALTMTALGGFGALVLPASAQSAPPDDFEVSSSGLKYHDVRVGNGLSPRSGKTAVVHYTGWVFRDGAPQEMFDTSRDVNIPFSFVVGEGRVIRGWEEGVRSMQVGGRRLLLIPPHLGYGVRGAGGGAIPPNATLLFDVELIDVK